MRTLRIALAALTLSAPAAAQINIGDTPIPATRPEVTHHVTATKSLHYGEVWYEFDLATIGDVTATVRDLPPLPDGRRDLDGAVVQIHGIDGFPAGSTWQDYVVRTDMLWFSEYDWVAAENPTGQTRPASEVATQLIPRLLCFDVRQVYDTGPGWQTGIGFGMYNVSFGLGHQDLTQLGAWDGDHDWSGSSGDWSGEINNTNPTADDQEMSGDYWTARNLWAQYGNDPDREVPVYFTPLTSWVWSDPGYGHECRWTLPEPSCVGCEPRPARKDTNCGGHAASWPYCERMDIRGTGGPSGGGWRMRIRVVPADSLPLEYDPDGSTDWIRTRELLSKALLMSPRSEWPKLIEDQERIVSVDPTERVDLRTGMRTVGCLIGWREELPE